MSDFNSPYIISAVDKIMDAAAKLDVADQYEIVKGLTKIEPMLINTKRLGEWCHDNAHFMKEVVKSQ